MKLAANESPAPPVPRSEPATHSGIMPLDLTSRRVSALMNVLVFTPYAIYLARGQLPPPWLIVASLAWTGINFADDLKYLIRGEEAIEGELGSGGCGCHGLGRLAPDPLLDGRREREGIVTGSRTTPLWATPPQVAWHRYRVNR